MRVSNFSAAVFLTGVLGCFPVSAQHVISAKSGLVHYTEGSVSVGDQPASPNNSTFQYVANGQELRAGEGRAEILLAPGQFLRLNENSSIKMISNKLDDTRVEVLKGSTILEVVEIQKGSNLTMVYGAYSMEIRKPGLYRIDADPAQLRVYKGEAIVAGTGQSTTAKDGKEVLLGAVLGTEKFDVTTGDEFARWAERRAGYIATANVSAAREAYLGSNFNNMNSWYFNPWYGMYTYLPSNRPYFMSPFGFYYFSPDFAFNNSLWPYFGYGYYGGGYYGSGYGYGYASSGGGSSTGSTVSSGSALAKQPFPGAANRGLGHGPRGIERPVFSGPANAFSPGLGQTAGRSFSGGGGVNNHGGGVYGGGVGASHASGGGGGTSFVNASSGGGHSAASSATSTSSSTSSAPAASHVK